MPHRRPPNLTLTNWDLGIAFAGTPRPDGSVNQLWWFSRRLAMAFG
jgi:hypothetical protein